MTSYDSHAGLSDTRLRCFRLPAAIAPISPEKPRKPSVALPGLLVREGLEIYQAYLQVLSRQ